MRCWEGRCPPGSAPGRRRRGRGSPELGWDDRWIRGGWRGQKWGRRGRRTAWGGRAASLGTRAPAGLESPTGGGRRESWKEVAGRAQAGLALGPGPGSLEWEVPGLVPGALAAGRGRSGGSGSAAAGLAVDTRDSLPSGAVWMGAGNTGAGMPARGHCSLCLEEGGWGPPRLLPLCQENLNGLDLQCQRQSHQKPGRGPGVPEWGRGTQDHLKTRSKAQRHGASIGTGARSGASPGHRTRGQQEKAVGRFLHRSPAHTPDSTLAWQHQAKAFEQVAVEGP